MLGVVAHAFNLSPWETEAENLSRFEASLIYIMRLCLKNVF